MTLVWQHSKQKGSALIMLLAIADHADDAGVAYPGVESLAQKCRMSERNIRYLGESLAQSGELEIVLNAGPRGTNLYKLKVNPNLELFNGEENIAGRGKTLPPGRPASKKGVGGRKASVGGAAIAVAAESSRTVSTREPSSTPPPPPIPKKRGKSHLPSDFGISESVRRWGIEQGYAAYLEHHLAYFIDYARSNGKQYLDWDGAFRNCIRSDWGRVRFDLVKRGWKPAQQQVTCQFIDRQGSDICGMTPARETAYYGGKPICQHHEDKLAKPNLSMEAVNAHLKNLKTIARAQS